MNYQAPINEDLLVKCQKKGFDGDIYLFDPMRALLPDVVRWLREKQKLHVYSEYKAFFQEKPRKIYYHWMPFIKRLPDCKHKLPMSVENYGLEEYCGSYEEACIKAVEYIIDDLI